LRLFKEDADARGNGNERSKRVASCDCPINLLPSMLLPSMLLPSALLPSALLPSMLLLSAPLPFALLRLCCCMHLLFLW
jgi:hypothetical protein